ncbi:MAG: hypothetical protein IJX49_03465 [Clostridia bacterium]|nr:hypothetical protein [Clostridia bacterium]
MYDFLIDLDEFFCEKYANYDKLCILPGYKMPVMQASEVREDGRTYAYTLPANTMRLATQEKKAELLAELKSRMTDTTFSFSFRVIGFWARLKNRFSKYGFYKLLNKVLAKYDYTDENVFEQIDIDPEIWKGICKNKFLPTKNLILSLALSAHMSLDDTVALLNQCGYILDYAIVKDVVIAYLLANKVYNSAMVEAALKEYKVGNLFLKD